MSKKTIKVSLGTVTTFPIRKALEEPTRTLKSIGDLLSAAAQKAFKDQKFGSQSWEPRYPNQSEPFINIAGAVQDLSKGPNIKPRRFDRRPALKDTGVLSNSLDSNKSVTLKGQYTVEVGTTVPYASTMMFGGESRQAITDSIRSNFVKVQKRMSGSLKREGKKLAKGTGSAEKVVGAAKKLTAISRLNSVMQRDVLVTKAFPRPFLGITDEIANKITRVITLNIPKVVK